MNAKIWGLDARGLHDRFWAGRGVRVVRRGSTVLDDAGCAAYLLIEADDLVLFDPPPAPRAGAVCTRLLDDDGGGYTERVIAGESSRLVALRRLYAPPVRRSRRLLVTSCPRLAAIWQRSPTRRAGLRDVRLAAGLKHYRHASSSGRIFDGAASAEAPLYVVALMEQWRRVGTCCRGVTARGPGVWAHETATIGPGARFVGPVWIGAGARIEAGRVVVGPRVVEDEMPVEPAPVPVVRRARWAPRGAEPSPRQSAWRGRAVRRLFDIAFSAAALVVAAPLFPLIMAAIWLEDGRPVFFAHRRQTLAGRAFVCFKFRTMCRGAEQLKPQLVTRNACDGPQFHIEDDPRLLRVGRFLRRFHLDELPQFINVLLGHMAVIGPRPSPDDENQFCPAWRDARLSVRPGLTGLWQVSRTRAEHSDFQEWIRHDLDYLDYRNWRLDLLIIVKTTAIFLGRPRAGARHPRRRLARHAS